MKLLITLLALSFLASCATEISAERAEEIKQERIKRKMQSQGI